MRVCNTCGVEKPLNAFAFTGKGYRRRKCRRCQQREPRRRWRENRKKSVQRDGLRLTFDAYQALIAAHDGRCQICGRDTPDPHLDHDHDTGRVRGLLCLSCNLGLGHFKDDVAVLQAAVAYLERSRVRGTMSPPD